jgi:hypothetical protein
MCMLGITHGLASFARDRRDGESVLCPALPKPHCPIDNSVLAVARCLRRTIRQSVRLHFTS